MNRILIVDDEKEICESIKLILEFEDYTAGYINDGNLAPSVLSEEAYDMVLLDIQMGNSNGFEILQQIKAVHPALPVVMISAYGNIQNAVQATRLGAFDFLEKPIDRDKLLITVRNALSQINLARENERLRIESLSDTKILGESSAIKKVLDLIAKVAETDVRVFITGENGTGKELVAKAIHEMSQRKNSPYVDINCAAIPNELIESELFGHEKGAFTGAIQNKTGKFELAHKGTLFLDEIGDMSLQAQAKVLRIIEEGKVEKVGGNKKTEVDVRIISATNKNLKEEIEKGNFREDLFHRLNVIPIVIPPLRERTEDIPILVKAFTERISEKYKKKTKHFSNDAIELMKQLPWKGNIRELRNIVERIIIIIDKPVIQKSDLESLLPYEKQSINDLIDQSNSFQDFKEKAEKAFILKQLEANGWNVSKTAELLEIQRSHLYNKMKKYGIEKGE
ncbi:MAG: sigma-54-dependent Fis family transcriptional regulator [Ignavibacteriales bacterium]|nr:Transcriptional regulatory protein ZraR [Ignavibacteriaceae bacterium]QOJ29223.1 MAG: sigma-54-dependent Fis family transcriptional regulator [Ignavibacteriales bacterium]